MEPEAINTVAAAFVAGCVTSVHCVGMCGPLACAVVPSQRDSSPAVVATLYHLGRMIAYACVGALAGILGRAPLAWLSDSPVSLVPWVLAAAFLLVGLGLEQKIPRPALLGKWLFRLRLRASAVRGESGAFLLGAGTPLLPCGPLYLMFGIALVSGSALRGAELCLAFSLGTVPLLWLAQSQFGVLQRRLGPGSLRKLQRSGALAAAVILAWRLRDTLWFVEDAASCCH